MNFVYIHNDLTYCSKERNLSEEKVLLSFYLKIFSKS